MNAPSVDIKDMLVAGGLGLVAGTNLFIGNEPKSPDNVVTVYDPSYGLPPDMTLNPAEGPYERLTLQIRVRNRTYDEGYSVINGIYSLLHGRAHETWNGTIYEVITSSTPIHLDWDDNHRPRFIINLNLQRR